MEATLEGGLYPRTKTVHHECSGSGLARLLRGRSIILKITRARNSIKFSKIHSSRGLAARIRRFIITEKAPTRAFSWLKAATTAFTFETLLRHYAKRALTPRSLNVKLGPRRKGRFG